MLREMQRSSQCRLYQYYSLFSVKQRSPPPGLVRSSISGSDESCGIVLIKVIIRKLIAFESLMDNNFSQIFAEKNADKR